MLLGGPATPPRSKPTYRSCWHGTRSKSGTRPPTSTTQPGSGPSPWQARPVYRRSPHGRGHLSAGVIFCWHRERLPPPLACWRKRSEHAFTVTLSKRCRTEAGKLRWRSVFACSAVRWPCSSYPGRRRRSGGVGTPGRTYPSTRVCLPHHEHFTGQSSGLSRERSIGLASSISTPGKNKFSEKPWRNMMAPLPTPRCSGSFVSSSSFAGIRRQPRRSAWRRSKPRVDR